MGEIEKNLSIEMPIALNAIEEKLGDLTPKEQFVTLKHIFARLETIGDFWVSYEVASKYLASKKLAKSNFFFRSILGFISKAGDNF